MRIAGPGSDSRLFTDIKPLPCSNGRDQMQEDTAVPQHALYAMPAQDKAPAQRALRIALMSISITYRIGPEY